MPWLLTDKTHNNSRLTSDRSKNFDTKFIYVNRALNSLFASCEPTQPATIFAPAILKILLNFFSPPYIYSSARKFLILLSKTWVITHGNLIYSPKISSLKSRLITKVLSKVQYNEHKESMLQVGTEDVVAITADLNGVCPCQMCVSVCVSV